MEPPGEAAQVAVTGDDSVEVPELDEIPVSSGASGAQHGTVSGGEDRRPRRGGVVGALVAAPNPQHRLEPRAGEGRGDPPELDRRPEEGAAKRAAAGVVVG